MKRVIRITGIVFFTLLILIGILFLVARHEYEKVHRDDVAYCEIHLGENIDNLTSIDIVICDRTYNYTINQLKDTVGENLSISDESFPCPVYAKYNFSSGEKKTIVADSFNAGGYSGTNIYTLKKDTIIYRYAP